MADLDQIDRGRRRSAQARRDGWLLRCVAIAWVCGVAWLALRPVDAGVSHAAAGDPAEVAAFERGSAWAGARAVILMLEGDGAARRIGAVERSAATDPAVRWTWSVDSAREVAQTEQVPPGLARVLAPDPSTAVVLLGVEPGLAATWEGALRDRVASHLRPDDRLTLVGEPTVRAATAHALQSELRWLVPGLIGIVILVPWLSLGHLRAAFFPLAVAGLSACATLVIASVCAVELAAAAVVILPLVWAIGTLDAIHLYVRHAALAADGRPQPERRAVYQLTGPCLLTTLTTAAGLLIMASTTHAPIVRDLGVWGGIGSILALAVTLGLGPVFLRRFPNPGPPRPASLALRLSKAARRRPAAFLAGGLLVTSLAAVAAAHTTIEATAPHSFAADTQPARDLERVRDRLGIELAPVELVMRADVDATDEAWFGAQTVVQHRLERLDAVAVAVSPALFIRDRIRRDPALLEGPRARASVPHVGGERVATSLILLRSGPAGRGPELIERLSRVDAGLARVHVHWGGARYFNLKAHITSARAAFVGAFATLAIGLLCIAVVTRRKRLVLVAALGNLVPLVVVIGLMGALAIPWRTALLAVPIVLLAVAVDDTIHLLWAVRHRPDDPGALTRCVARVGPALTTTTAILSGCFALQLASAFRAPREIGLLLAAGLLTALVCDLTLVPAALSASRGQRTRP